MNIFEKNIKDCYGCGMCATVCPHNVIGIELNESGFYEPSPINLEHCTNCGLCLKTCSIVDDKLSLNKLEIKSYGAWSNDSEVRRKCSSGGVGFEIGRTLIADGYKVCAVRFNAEANRAEHFVASTVEELEASIGSKYIQSYTLDGFRAVNRQQKNVIIGTPCQIDSFRRYINITKQEDNFVFVDFFCHGVPSKLLWDKYLKWVKSKVGEISSVTWRNKKAGWHESWDMSIKGNNSEFNSKLSQGDIFYRLFLSDTCLGKACYEKCKYKYDQSSADIRLGDAWGFHYDNNEDGVSCAIAFTAKGNELLHRLNCTLEELSFDTVCEWQMKKCANKPHFNKKMMSMLKDETIEIEEIMDKSETFLRWMRLKDRLMNPRRTIMNILKRFRKL